MNKTELITFLRDPNRLSSEQLEELEAIVNENPYFLSARLLLAKASKEQNHPQTKKRVASAAIYSTDRVLFKKYLNGNLFFLSQPPKPEEAAPEPATSRAPKPDRKEESVKIPIQQREKQPTPESPVEPASKPQPTEKEAPKEQKTANVPVSSTEEEKPARVDKRPSAITKKPEKKQLEVPELPSGDLDSILDELQQDMANLKVSREKFSEVQKKIEEDDAVSAALEKASTKEAPKLEVPATTPTPPAGEEKEVEAPKVEATETETSEESEAKRSASEITMQILEAAKKAKEEVAKEDVAKEEKAAIEQAEADKKPSQPSEVEAKKDITKTESKDSKKVEEEKDDSPDSERAERAIREPRFSRFASRSYLKPPEEIPADFLDDDKDTEKEQSQEPKADEEKKKESSSDIKLPDLSKAKPVARRSRSKREKSTEKDLEKKAAKKEEETKAVEDKPTEKKSTEKKPTAKTTAKTSKKTEEKKSTVKKATEKKTEEKKSTTKKATEKKPAAKKTTEKKTTTKKAVEKKPVTKKTSEKKPTVKKTVEKKTTTRKSTATTKKEGAKSKSKPAAKSKSATSKKDKKDDDKGDRKAQEDIINKFIKESPSIKYQRKESTDTEDLSEDSSAWDPNLASEYLAEIYLHQGNKKRAVEIYEALSLKYPEKKSYFADLISKIE